MADEITGNSNSLLSGANIGEIAYNISIWCKSISKSIGGFSSSLVSHPERSIGLTSLIRNTNERIAPANTFNINDIYCQYTEIWRYCVESMMLPDSTDVKIASKANVQDVMRYFLLSIVCDMIKFCGVLGKYLEMHAVDSNSMISAPAYSLLLISQNDVLRNTVSYMNVMFRWISVHWKHGGSIYYPTAIKLIDCIRSCISCILKIESDVPTVGLGPAKVDWELYCVLCETIHNHLHPALKKRQQVLEGVCLDLELDRYTFFCEPGDSEGISSKSVGKFQGKAKQQDRNEDIPSDGFPSPTLIYEKKMCILSQCKLLLCVMDTIGVLLWHLRVQLEVVNGGCQGQSAENGEGRLGQNCVVKNLAVGGAGDDAIPLTAFDLTSENVAKTCQMLNILYDSYLDIMNVPASKGKNHVANDATVILDRMCALLTHNDEDVVQFLVKQVEICLTHQQVDVLLLNWCSETECPESNDSTISTIIPEGDPPSTVSMKDCSSLLTNIRAFDCLIAIESAHSAAGITTTYASSPRYETLYIQFHWFLNSVLHMDVAFLLDLLGSSETSCLEYILRVTRLMISDPEGLLRCYRSWQQNKRLLLSLSSRGSARNLVSKDNCLDGSDWGDNDSDNEICLEGSDSGDNDSGDDDCFDDSDSGDSDSGDDDCFDDSDSGDNDSGNDYCGFQCSLLLELITFLSELHMKLSGESGSRKGLGFNPTKLCTRLRVIVQNITLLSQSKILEEPERRKTSGVFSS